MTDVPEPKMKIGISVETTQQMAPFEGFKACAWVSVAIDNMIPANELKGIYDEYRPELMSELTRQIDAERARRMYPNGKPAQPPAPSPSAVKAPEAKPTLLEQASKGTTICPKCSSYKAPENELCAKCRGWK